MILPLRGSGASLLVCSLVLGLAAPGTAQERQPRAGATVPAAASTPAGAGVVTGPRRPKAGLAVAAPAAMEAAAPGAPVARPPCGRKYCSNPSPADPRLPTP
jgi:hypothetical protein